MAEGPLLTRRSLASGEFNRPPTDANEVQPSVQFSGRPTERGFQVRPSSLYSRFARLPLYSAGPGTGAQFRSEVRPDMACDLAEAHARFRGILLRKARGDQVMARILQNKAFFSGIHRGRDGPFTGWRRTHSYGPFEHIRIWSTRSCIAWRLLPMRNTLDSIKILHWPAVRSYSF